MPPWPRSIVHEPLHKAQSGSMVVGLVNSPSVRIDGCSDGVVDLGAGHLRMVA
jgi:hypothetical protein